MASGPENTFNKALERFRDSLTEEQKRQFSATRFEDVESEIQNIQHRFGLEKKLRNLKKVSKFLEAMKQIEQVITVFLNVHEVVAFVWGPIKLALVVAGTRIDVLERLLDTYVEIGDVIPGLRQYDQLFKNCPAAKEVLERYFYDILQFHRKTLDLFARPAWETVLRSAWKTFETSFKPILDSLKRHRTLLSDEKLTAAIAEIQDIRQFNVTRFNELSQQQHNRFQELSKQLYEFQERLAEKEAREQQEALRLQRRIIAEKLGPPDYEADQHRASEQRFSPSGDWILKDPSFLHWFDSRNPSYSTKRFTRAYNLCSHLRTHTDEKPFVCSVCGKAFARQHDRKGHEGLHIGDKKFVCRGALKGGDNWGCGRRFARADALGRHFWSEVGRVCIKPLLEEERQDRGHGILEIAEVPLTPATEAQNTITLPAALLVQYPALAAIDWSLPPPNEPDVENDISGRRSLDSGYDTLGHSGFDSSLDDVHEDQEPNDIKAPSSFDAFQFVEHEDQEANDTLSAPPASLSAYAFANQVARKEARSEAAFNEKLRESGSNNKRPVDPNDEVALKRARNPFAAREARQRNFDHVNELEKRNAELEAEVEKWKSLAHARGDESTDTSTKDKDTRSRDVGDHDAHSMIVENGDDPVSESIAETEDFKKHMLKHVQPHTCDVPGCRLADKGFTTSNDLLRHKKSVHQIGVERPSYRCASGNCRNGGKIWARLDSFKQHIARMHKDEDEQELIRKSAYLGPYTPTTEALSVIPMDITLAGIGTLEEDLHRPTLRFAPHAPPPPTTAYPSDPDDMVYSDISQAKPLPGQLENCEICSKRFTVIPYSKAGPDGGLVCTPCGKELAKDSKAAEKAEYMALPWLQPGKKRPAESDFEARRGKVLALTEMYAPDYSRDLPHLKSLPNDSISLADVANSVEGLPNPHTFTPRTDRNPQDDEGVVDIGVIGVEVRSDEDTVVPGETPPKLKDIHSLDPVPSDSGYHSGLGTDTESVCSMDSMGSSLGLPQNFLQDFISFFGDTLIEKAGARQWAEYALAHYSSEEIEKRLNALLKEYAIELASKPPISWGSDNLDAIQDVRTSGQTQKVLAGATNLIRRYRPKIARYFRDNAVSVPVNATSLSVCLQELGQQLSLSERLGLFAKPGSNKKDPTETALDGQADDEMIDDTEEGDLFANLEPVRDMLVSSDAFRRLALDLRRKLYHDDGVEMENIGRMLMEDKSNLRVGSGAYEASFNVDWSIGEFMHSQYGENFPRIGSVVVITGSALYAQATTCAEYITTTWPKTGPFFLKLLDDILEKASTASDALQKGLCIASIELGLFVTASTYVPSSVNAIKGNPLGKFSFFARGIDETLLVELAQQLAWLGSALSTSPFYDQLAYSKPSFHRMSSQKFEIIFKHTPLHATETACWLPLFCGAVISSGFPIPKRGDEMGLEIPLELLAGLAGVRHAVEYEGGVVMKGFSHMFVPVRKDANRVQWHGISSQDPETRLSYHGALSRCASRASLQEVSLDDLPSSRAIVGWCSVATSRLGSDSANYENIDYSKAEEADSGIRCAGGSFGFQQFGTAALDFRFGAKDGKCHFQRNGPFQKIVSAAEETPVVLYDTGEKRTWLVPASDVMLHMIQHRHRLKPFKVDGKRIRLDTNIPAGSSASNVLLKNKSLRLSDDEYTFKDDILNIWSLLEFLLDQNVTRYRNALGASIKGTLREFLHGFEFKAVVRERSPFRLKEAQLSKTNGGWPLLVRDIDALVLLADGFEDIIVPAEEGNTGLCRRWQRVPKELDYLTTSTKTLQQLYDEAGSRLDREYLTSKHQLRWHQGDSILFDTCENSSRCECDRLQQIFPKSAIGTIVPPERIADEGAVIFGRSNLDLILKPRAEAPKVSGIYSQPNAPLTPIIIRHESEDSNFSDSTLSGRSGSDATERSTPGSLSSCTTLTTQDAPSEIHELDTNTELIPFSRKRLRLPETCIKFSGKDEKVHEASSGCARKRAKSVQMYDGPHLSPFHCYRGSSESVRGQRHGRSDSIMQRSNVETELSDSFHDSTPAPTLISEDEVYVGDRKKLGSALSVVRLADEEPLRTLRRREGFH